MTLMTFLPLLGVLLIGTLRGEPGAVARQSRLIAMFASGMVFLLSLYMLQHFDGSNAGFQFVEKTAWLPSIGLSYHMGVDGISIFFVALSAFLTPLCILSAWDSVKMRTREYMMAFLFLETFMVGTFCALDAVLFYVFFEGVLLPMFLIIGVWGGERRVYAAFKFFLYTLLGSVLMLVALLAMYAIAGTTDIAALMDYNFSRPMQFWLFLAFFASFAVKMPMWPVHTWLPDAHVEAPTAGSVILAGVLLKMGGYGFLRFSLPMFPDASEFFAPFVFTLSVIAIIYTSLVALVQEDMKKLIAYSSVAHMGFVTMGIFAMTIEGVQGAVYQMLSHGIISAALFLVVGVVYDRMHTRRIDAYGGLVHTMPNYAVVFMLLLLGAVGLPGTSGFVGEFLVLLGTYKVNTTAATLAGLGVVLGAAYMLTLYRAVIFGAKNTGEAAHMPDLNFREWAVFLPLVILVIWFGLFPNSILGRTEAAVQNMIAHYQADLGHDPQGRGDHTPIPGDIVIRPNMPDDVLPEESKK